MTSAPLTKREAWSGTFEDIFDQRDTPRTDCPKTLPIPDALKDHYYQYSKTENMKESEIQDIDQWIKDHPRYQHKTPISDLQMEMVRTASGLTFPPADFSEIDTVHEGALFVREQMKAYQEKYLKK